MLLAALLLTAAAPSLAAADPAADALIPRDPFRSILATTDEPPKKKPLERFPVDTMKLQGVAAGTASPRALLELPDGSVHVVRVGQTVGPSMGRVALIHAGAVTVVEEFRDAITGVRIQRKHVLATTTTKI